MIDVHLRYVHRFVDRHGIERFYFRRYGLRTPLPSPGSPAFMPAYQAALDGVPPPAVPVGAARTAPGTVAAAVVGYYASRNFLALAVETKAHYRIVLEQFRADHGPKPLALLERKHVEAILAAKAATPDMANSLLKRIRALMQFAVSAGMITVDPTIGIKPMKKRNTGGFKVWSEDSIAAYRAHHAIGTSPRLALELLIGTIQRRGDVVRLGRQHLDRGVLAFRQHKTKTEMVIPILPELRVALDAMVASTNTMTFLTTETGRPFTARYFGKWFRRQCAAAGVALGYSAHGLRKAGATRLADNGATASELCSWGGWRTLAEAEKYVREANRRRLARGSADKLATPRSED
jgi:integrase